MYGIRDICAVIISYNDADALSENISALVRQVDHILVIDNGSNKDCLNKLSKIADRFSVIVKYDSKNRGIAYQLNKGLEYCRKKGYSLMLSMDQDTKLKPGCVIEMLRVMNSMDNVVSVGPNREFPRWSNITCFKEKKYLITSGNLVVVDKAISAGGYFNELFIDMVDIDFSLALKSAGYKIGIAAKATMDHQVGVKEKSNFLFFKVEYLSHSLKRFYYIYRNRQIICRKYFKRFPLYCIKMWSSLLLCTLFLFLEQNYINKAKYAFKGTIDGLKFDINSKDNFNYRKIETKKENDELCN